MVRHGVRFVKKILAVWPLPSRGSNIIFYVASSLLVVIKGNSRDADKFDNFYMTGTIFDRSYIAVVNT